MRQLDNQILDHNSLRDYFPSCFLIQSFYDSLSGEL
jgi:hypothetical protein